eukprot:TRINITY_DN4243_c0_g1_i1.p1 TRINITY_DN4243_c0_g1~~TRINITY_DN4243_c0_g1_i1.p1  ORF type:complete len:580 (+),score=90.01 TRINITY_DN4243_c0_g1_i1:127-1740(+)
MVCWVLSLQVWVFGGLVKDNGKAADVNELWVYDLALGLWTHQVPLGVLPPPRSGVRGARWGDKFVIHGGYSSLTERDYADTWAYNFANKRWYLLNDGQQPSTPGSRFNHAMAIVEGVGSGGSDVLAIHGGVHVKSANQQVLLSDVWQTELDSTGVSAADWTQLNWDPSLTRMSAAMVAYEGRVWEFGGIYDVAVSQYIGTDRLITGSPGSASVGRRALQAAADDSTALADEGKWMEYTPGNLAVIGARAEHTAQVWRGQLIIYGGLSSEDSEAADVWSLDLSSIDAAQLSAAVDDPQPQLVGQMFSLMHLLFALGLLSLCLCVFLSTVRRQMDRRARNALNGSTHPTGFAIMLRVPTPRRLGVTDDDLARMPIVLYGETPTPTKPVEKDPAGLQSEETDALAADTHPDALQPKQLHSSCDDSCAICLEPYIAQDRLRMLPCSHLFHVNCIDSWLRSSSPPACPMCKQRVVPEEAAPPEPSRASSVDATMGSIGGARHSFTDRLRQWRHRDSDDASQQPQASSTAQPQDVAATAMPPV